MRLKAIIDADVEIQELQKQVVDLTDSGNKVEADALLGRLNNLPIIINFQIVKEQLADTLRVISDILK